MNTDLYNMYRQLKISESVLDYCSKIEEGLKERFETIDSVAEYNQMKVIAAMQKNQLSDIHFAATTGYGYNDIGRDVQWLVKVSWLGRLVLEFWWVELGFFSISMWL